MARRLHREWSDRKPFTRRVRWYADPDVYVNDIRLEFDDRDGSISRFYQNDSVRAEGDFQAFKQGHLGTLKIQKERK